MDDVENGPRSIEIAARPADCLSWKMKNHIAVPRAGERGGIDWPIRGPELILGL